MITQNKQLKKRRRVNRLKRKRNLQKANAQRLRTKIEKQMFPEPQKLSLKMIFYTLFRDFMVFLGKIGCKIGIHSWRICSGRPGNPKYACIRCWARSKILWKDKGSAEYYKEKEQKNE